MLLLWRYFGSRTGCHVGRGEDCCEAKASAVMPRVTVVGDGGAVESNYQDVGAVRDGGGEREGEGEGDGDQERSCGEITVTALRKGSRV